MKLMGKLHRDDRQYIGGLWQILVMMLHSGNDVAWNEKREMSNLFS